MLIKLLLGFCGILGADGLISKSSGTTEFKFST